jgi:raffinose/stachyose/melibiose transport system substrate-binding protein
VSAGPARVSWWLGRGPRADRFRELFVDPFNERQSHIHLDVRALGSHALRQTVEALERGNGPDLVMVPRAGEFVSLIRRHLLLDLTAFAEQYGWAARLLAPATRLATIGGRLYGLPRSSETMFLLCHPATGRPPTTLGELSSVAADATRNGVLPFGGGCGDFPESCELLWTLVVNHAAGPAAVRGALRSELPWTSSVFVTAIELLQEWFQQGWFGDDYFTRTITQGLDLVVDGRAAMSPAMTGMLPPARAQVKASPFPVLRSGIPTPLFVFGTASLIGINTASSVPDHAAAVMDAVFRSHVRRTFATNEPGDWNIPLVDPDADELARTAPAAFTTPAVGLTRAVNARHFGYASWSYLSPAAEAVVVAQVRALAEARLTARRHLADLQAAAAAGRAPGVD